MSKCSVVDSIKLTALLIQWATTVFSVMLCIANMYKCTLRNRTVAHTHKWTFCLYSIVENENNFFSSWVQIQFPFWAQNKFNTVSGLYYCTTEERIQFYYNQSVRAQFHIRAHTKSVSCIFSRMQFTFHMDHNTRTQTIKFDLYSV